METKDIKALIKELRKQRDLVLKSFRCETMTKEQIHYVKEGMKIAFETCIETLKDEL